MQEIQIFAVLFTCGLFTTVSLYVAFLARKDSAQMRNLSVEFSKLASARSIKDRIEEVSNLIEIHGLKIGELSGQLNALEQTTKSHLQRYYKLEREQRKDVESQQLNDALQENLEALNDGVPAEISGPSNAHLLTRQMGW